MQPLQPKDVIPPRLEPLISTSQSDSCDHHSVFDHRAFQIVASKAVTMAETSFLSYPSTRRLSSPTPRRRLSMNPFTRNRRQRMALARRSDLYLFHTFDLDATFSYLS